MKLIRDFAVALPALLKQQLARLEANVAAEFLAARSAALLALVPLPRFTKSNTTPILIGQCAEFDTTLGALTATLERPSRAMANQLLAIVCRVTGAPLTIKVAPPPVGGTQGRINNSSSISTSAAGLKLILCDGADYWST